MSTPPRSLADRRKYAFLAAALVLLAILSYANTIDHPFIYDDVSIVLKNPVVRHLVVPHIFGAPGGLDTRWVRTFSHRVEYALVGAWPPLYHANNIALHALIGLLVFGAMTRITRDRMMSWWVAALFAVHPINSDVVAQVAGRRGVLTAAFSMVALILLLDYTRKGGWWRMVVALLSIYLGAFSKPTAVLTCVVFVLADIYRRVQSREGGEGALIAQAWRLFRGRWLVYSIPVVFSLGLTAWILGTGGQSSGYYETVESGIAPTDRARIVGLGLRLLLLPIGQSVDYSYDALGLTGAWSASATIDVVVLLAAVAAVLIGLWRRNPLGLAGGWFLAYFTPHLGLVKWHEIFAERFLYLPSVGFCLAVAWAGITLARRPGWLRPMTAAGIVAIGLLTAATVTRNEVWRSEMALWSDAVERYPSCARAHKALGDAYLDQTRAGSAMEHYREAARILPRYLDARVGIAVSEVALGKYEAARDELEGVLGIYPTEPKALNLQGYIHQTLGDFPAAIAAYERAVETNPRFAEGYNNLARLYVEQGKLDRAVEMYETALEHDPALIPALLNLAIVYRMGFEDEERAQFYEGQAEKLRAIQ